VFFTQGILLSGVGGGIGFLVALVFGLYFKKPCLLFKFQGRIWRIPLPWSGLPFGQYSSLLGG